MRPIKRRIRPSFARLQKVRLWIWPGQIRNQRLTQIVTVNRRWTRLQNSATRRYQIKAKKRATQRQQNNRQVNPTNWQWPTLDKVKRSTNCWPSVRITLTSQSTSTPLKGVWHAPGVYGFSQEYRGVGTWATSSKRKALEKELGIWLEG